MRKMAAMTPPVSEKSGALIGWLSYVALLALGTTIYVLCRFFPADLPEWMPWEFS